ncbi:hypothetical protein Tco_0417069 [Tanacetum coccineum]
MGTTAANREDTRRWKRCYTLAFNALTSGVTNFGLSLDDAEPISGPFVQKLPTADSSYLWEVQNKIRKELVDVVLMLSKTTKLENGVRISESRETNESEQYKVVPGLMFQRASMENRRR